MRKGQAVMRGVEEMVRHAVEGHTPHPSAIQRCLEPTPSRQPSQCHCHPVLTPTPVHPRPLSTQPCGPRTGRAHTTCTNSPLSTAEFHPFPRLCYPLKPGIWGPSHLPEPQCAHVECGVVWGGGVRLGGGSDSCFLPLLTRPREVTESGEASRVSAWAEYLDPCERPEWGAGEGS